MSTETLDHRERRLGAMGDAVEGQLDEGWVYWLVLGKPGEDDSINVVSNVPAGETAERMLEAILEVIREGYSCRDLRKKGELK